jgi:endonuclease/exonuclease/phosphatase family metal-dependent hydrolase
MRIISWNIHQQPEPWYVLASDEALDFALVQEAKPPPTGLGLNVHPGPSAWADRSFRTAVAARGSKFPVKFVPSARVGQAGRGIVPESRPGTIAAAEVSLTTGEVVTLVSVYAAWENPTPEQSAWNIFADASAHRVISDVSALIGSAKGHRIIVAGDFNCLHGYGENGSRYWKGRYETIFTRMEALGLPFVGPQHPNGTQAEPWPDELPRDSKNVPTFRTNAGLVARQLDFVFASRELVGRLKVSALNGPEWGPSDHCRVEITLAEE